MIVMDRPCSDYKSEIISRLLSTLPILSFSLQMFVTRQSTVPPPPLHRSGFYRTTLTFRDICDSSVFIKRRGSLVCLRLP